VVGQVLGARAYLDGEEEKVEVEVETAQDVFVGRCHENRTATVCKDGDNRAVQLGGLRSSRHPLRGSSIKGAIALLLSELDRVVFVLLVVGHGCEIEGWSGQGDRRRTRKRLSWLWAIIRVFNVLGLAASLTVGELTLVLLAVASPCLLLL
jgi:hypothetical protein